MFMNPAFSPFGSRVLLQDAGQSYGSAAIHQDEQISWLQERGLLENGASLLDVGCYDGAFLRRLPPGVTKIGVDFDAPAIERGRRALADTDSEMIAGDFESFVTSNVPDTIVMFHVLEHVLNPSAVLAKLRSLAHEKTRLVVEVPVVESGESNDLVGFFTVLHLTLFSRRSLDNCLRRSGWEPVESLEHSDYNGRRVLAFPAQPADTVPGDPADVAAGLRARSSWDLAAVEVAARVADLGAANCVIWGGGIHAEYLYQRTAFFQADQSRVYVIADRDPRKQGQSWRGIPIVHPDALTTADWAQTQMVISSYGSHDEIRDEALRFGVPAAAIVAPYDFVETY